MRRFTLWIRVPVRLVDRQLHQGEAEPVARRRLAAAQEDGNDGADLPGRKRTGLIEPPAQRPGERGHHHVVHRRAVLAGQPVHPCERDGARPGYALHQTERTAQGRGRIGGQGDQPGEGPPARELAARPFPGAARRFRQKPDFRRSRGGVFGEIEQDAHQCVGVDDAVVYAQEDGGAAGAFDDIDFPERLLSIEVRAHPLADELAQLRFAAGRRERQVMHVRAQIEPGVVLPLRQPERIARRDHALLEPRQVHEPLQSALECDGIEPALEGEQGRDDHPVRRRVHPQPDGIRGGQGFVTPWHRATSFAVHSKARAPGRCRIGAAASANSPRAVEARTFQEARRARRLV
jgi:hypothetical protein